MANEIQIIIKGVDKASKVFKDITSSTKGMTLAIGAITGVATSVGFAIKKVVDQTVEYGKTVDDLSRSLGTSTEEASKLIQIADDLRIEQGQLEMAFRFALNKGVAPTIEGLKGLAVEYQSIQDPVAKAQYAMEKFGTRGGLQMQKVLELSSEAIDDMAQSAEDAGLVLSREGVAATKAYYAEIDNLSDSLEGLKMSIGIGMIPFLTDLIKEFNELSGVDMFSPEFFAILKKYSGTFGDWGDAVQRANEAAQRFDAQKMVSSLGAINSAIEETTSTALPRISNTSGQFYALSSAIRKGAEAAEEAEEPIKNLLDGLDRDPSNPIAGFIKDLEWLQAGGLNINKKVEEIMAAVSTPGSGISPQEGKQMLEGAFAATEDLQAELGNITADEAAANVSSTLGISLEEAKARIDGTDGITAAMAAFTSQPWYVDIYYREHNKPDILGGGTVEVEPGLTPGGATGLHGIVPPGYPNDSYYIRATSGERVDVTPAGHSIGGRGGGGNVIFGDIIINALPGMDAEAVARYTSIAIEKRVSASMRAGAAYAGQ